MGILYELIVEVGENPDLNFEVERFDCARCGAQLAHVAGGFCQQCAEYIEEYNGN